MRIFSLVFFQPALEIREEYYNHFHIDISVSLYHIGTTLTYLGNFNEGLDYQKRAISIYKTYYKSDDM